MAHEPASREVWKPGQAGRKEDPPLWALEWDCRTWPSLHLGAWLCSFLPYLPVLPVPGTRLGTARGLQEFLWNECLSPRFPILPRLQFKKIPIYK